MDPPLGFLKLNTWVDLSAGAADEVALDTLTAAIRRQPPGPLALQQIAGVLAEVCPYRGLRPFREEDEPFFFGRVAFTETLTTILAAIPSSPSPSSARNHPPRAVFCAPGCVT